MGLCLLSLIVVSFTVGIQTHTTLKESAKKDLIKTVSEKTIQYNLIFQRLSEDIDAVKIFAADTFERTDTLSDLKSLVLMPWVGEGTGYGNNNGYGSTEVNARLAFKIPKLQRIGKILKSVARSNDLILMAYFVTPEGIFIADQDIAVTDIGKAEAWVPKRRPWYQAAITKRATTWTKPYVDVSTKDLIVTVSSPLYNNDRELLGIVAFDVRLQTIKDDILKIDLEYEGYSLLVGNDGKTLVSPDIDKKNTTWNNSYYADNLLETKNLEFNSIVRKMVRQKIGLGVYEGKAGANKYLAYAPLKTLDASLGIVVSESEVVAPALAMLKWIALVAAFVSLIAIFIGVLLANSIAKPILELTDIANDISSGKKELTTLTVTRTDELGLLTEALNRLISSLRIAMERKKKQKND